MNTVMVTGGSGFIGTYLSIGLVERGDKVVNYDVRPWSGMMEWLMAPYKSKVLFEPGSVENWPQLLSAVMKYKVNKIVHLASPIDTEYLSRMPRLAFDTVVSGTLNVLEAVRLLDVERLVYFSSIGVLPAVQYEPIDCNHPTVMAMEGPASGAYGAGKVSGEAFCWAYRQSYDIDFVIIRPSAVYGFGTKNRIYLNEMVEGALLGKPVRFEHGSEVPRDYTHVCDIAGIAMAALDAPARNLKHRVFYGATGGKLLTAGQVAEIVRAMIPTADIEIKPGLSYADTLEIRFRGVLDMRPVKEQLGYIVKYVDVRDGIAEVIERYNRYLADVRVGAASWA